jgi:heterogeneous nuclear ribonucleoprotein A1/A3
MRILQGNHELGGRHIDVKKAVSKQMMGMGGGGGGGRGRGGRGGRVSLSLPLC